MTLEDLLNSTKADVQVFVRARLNQASIRVPGEANWTTFDGASPSDALRKALESRLPAADVDDLI